MCKDRKEMLNETLGQVRPEKVRKNENIFFFFFFLPFDQLHLFL